MSSAGIWSGNFHHLGNNLASSCGPKLLRSQVVGTNQKPKSSKPYKVDLKLSDGTVGSSTNLNTNKSATHAFKDAQYYKLPQNIVEDRIFEWPAVVFVFDIETTGFSCRNERIIEIAIRDILGGSNSTFQTLVNPEKVILNSDIHGISTEMVNRPDVPRMKDLVPILIQYARSRQIAGKPVLWVAHNGRRFDVPFIVKEFDRCAAEVPSDWLFVDTLPLARQLVKPDGLKLSSISLRALGEHYEIPSAGQAHRAMQDVMTLCSVLQRMSFEMKLSVKELLEKRAFRASDL